METSSEQTREIYGHLVRYHGRFIARSTGKPAIVSPEPDAVPVGAYYVNQVREGEQIRQCRQKISVELGYVLAQLGDGWTTATQRPRRTARESGF